MREQLTPLQGIVTEGEALLHRGFQKVWTTKPQINAGLQFLDYHWGHLTFSLNNSSFLFRQLS